MCTFNPDDHVMMRHILPFLLSGPLTHLHFQVVSPIGLAAGILSMQEQAIPPPLQPNRTSFIFLVMVLMGLISSVLGLMANWKRIKYGMGRLLRRIRRVFYNNDLELQEV